MTEERETPITPTDPDVPSEPPPADNGTPEIDDQPLGVPAELDEASAAEGGRGDEREARGRAPLPGLPRTEPPQAG